MGLTTWSEGWWVKVYIPEFDVDDYMYITKVSQSYDGELKTNITLVDYPPGFGELKEQETSNDEETVETSTEATT